MSLLASHLRSILFSNLRPDMSASQRRAAWNLFNSIDSDLDIAGYTSNESSSTQEFVEKFEAILKHGEDNLIDDEVEELDEEVEVEDVLPSNRIIDIELDDDDIS